MKQGSLDANVILRIILDDIPNQHQDAVALFDRQGQYDLADIAVVETVFVLAMNYGLSRENISVALTAFLNLQNINCNAALFERALPMYVQHPALSFEDCCLAVYAELNNALPLYTFDKKLAAQTVQANLVG